MTRTQNERTGIIRRMKQRHSILLIICAVGIYACTAVESGVVSTEPRSATQHATVTGSVSLSREALSPSVPDEPGTVSGKQDSGSWTIEYEVSGGFAGIRRQLNLSGNGRIIASDLKRKRRVEQQAPPEQLVKIAEALSKIDLSRLPATGPKLSNRCADCFQHALTVANADQHYKLYVDDTTLKDPACAELIGLLSSLLNQALVKQEP